MGRTSTTFKKGHTGYGGRPRGTPNGAGRNAWRLAAKRVADLASQIDKIQSTLVAESSALTAASYVALSNLVRDRQKNYEERSQYQRPLVPERKIKVVFPNGVTHPTWKKADATQSPPGRKAKPVVLSDRIGRRATDKIKQLDQDTQKLLDGLSRLDFSITGESADSKARLTVLRRLIKVERDLLQRSRDPRPVVVSSAPFLIRFPHIPLDPLHPDSDGPLRSLGGRRASDIWSAEEIRADRMSREFESRPTESKLGNESKADQLTTEFTSSFDQNRDASSSRDQGADDPTRIGLHERDHCGPAAATGQASVGKSQAKEVEPGLSSTDEGLNIRDYVIMKDDPTPCWRCSGRGHRLINQTRPDETCPDCDGTGMIYDPRNQGGSSTD